MELSARVAAKDTWVPSVNGENFPELSLENNRDA